MSVILSIVAIVVSVVTSGITLLLTQFQGPDISLISSPKFEVSDDAMDERLKEWLRGTYVPNWLEVKATPFVFANHGGKSGTILSVDCHFTPNEEFREFFNRFYSSFSVLGEQMPSSAATIEDGGNKTIIAQLSLSLVDWKKVALAEALKPSLKIDDLISVAMQRSRENFERFCDFSKKTKEFGTLDCTISFTKGRFRTRVVTECLLKDVKLHNHCNHVLLTLRSFLQTWENRELTRSQLLNETKRDVEGISRELKDNINTLNNEVQDQTLSASRLRADAWKQLSDVSDPVEEKIRWFLILSDGNLKQKLAELYQNIQGYNSLIDDTIARGDLRRTKHLKAINEERKQLHLKAQKVLDDLSSLYLRSVP